MLSLGKDSPFFSTGAVITPHDSTANVYKALYVGGAGHVKVTTQGGSVILISAVPAGTLLPIAVSLVWSTGTTATLIAGLN